VRESQSETAMHGSRDIRNFCDEEGDSNNCNVRSPAEWGLLRVSCSSESPQVN